MTPETDQILADAVVRVLERCSAQRFDPGSTRPALDDLLEAAAIELADPAIALTAVDGLPVGSLGLIDYAFITSATLRDAVARTCRDRCGVSHRWRMLLHEEPPAAMLRLERDARGMRHGVELSFALLAHRMRYALGSAFVLHRVAFTHLAPGDASRHAAFFGVDPTFDAGVDELVFSRALLDVPLPTALPAVTDVIESRMRELDPTSGPIPGPIPGPQDAFLARVRAVIAALLDEGDASVDAACAALGMSRRTFQRELRRLGTSHRTILREIRRERAARLVSYRAPTSEVARSTGLSEPSSLYRALKRWNHEPPAATDAETPAECPTSVRPGAGIATELVHVIVRETLAMGVDSRLTGRADLDPFTDAAVADDAIGQVASTLGDPALALTLAERIPVGRLGQIDYLLVTSSHLRPGLQRVARCFGLVAQRATLALDEAGPHAYLRLERGAGIAHGRHGIELALAFLASRIRYALDVPLTFAVSFAHPAPADPARHESYFGAPVVFDAPSDVLAFDRRLLDAALVTAAPILADALELRLSELAPSSREAERPILIRAGRVIATLLDRGDTSIDAAAAALRMNRRTLQRALQELGTSHRELLEQIRRERHERLLEDGDRTVEVLARELGFSEPSAFHRARRRWEQSRRGS